MQTRIGRRGEETGAGERARDLEQGFEVAHELKNLLGAVKALVQLGLRNPAERASHERLAALEREVGRMQEFLLHGGLEGEPGEGTTGGLALSDGDGALARAAGD